MRRPRPTTTISRRAAAPVQLAGERVGGVDAVVADGRGELEREPVTRPHRQALEGAAHRSE
ncbi:hypothetical protein PS467_34815 [Streptomyces luomodiensis]|uniref:Uncharacterized protein n=1 Tax=Streptomyces luomodiensis TaxID=3026192 RepID=A0ABY9VDU2_9ACTN|nr:hypothetical protein [Streptomyces sp. SCA4-21]WNF00120.1 hypothetical protein PS467_34815 [Streptomyces sp. SCA4-21]